MLSRARAGPWDLDLDLVPDRPTEGAPEGYQYLRNTEALCEKLSIPDGYVAFLAASKLTQPTGMSADVYRTTERGQLVLRRDPGVNAPVSRTALVAADSSAGSRRWHIFAT